MINGTGPKIMGDWLTEARGEWLELLGDVLSRPLAEMPHQEIGELLARILECPGVAYHLRRPDGVVEQVVHGGGLTPEKIEEARRFAKERAHLVHPLLRHYLITDDWPLVPTSEVSSCVADARVRAAWLEEARPWGNPAQVSLPLVTTRPAHHAFVMGRRDDFTGPEMEFLGQVQRVLIGLERQVSAFAVAAPSSVPVGKVHLTPRETAVLGLVARGYKARAVARRLMISERTVHRHLGNAYAKLGVGDRVSAVSAARRRGLIV